MWGSHGAAEGCVGKIAEQWYASTVTTKHDCPAVRPPAKLAEKLAFMSWRVGILGNVTVV